MQNIVDGPFMIDCEAIDRFRLTLCETSDAIADDEFEILCIDDGSTDNTLMKLICLARTNPPRSPKRAFHVCCNFSSHG